MKPTTLVLSSFLVGVSLLATASSSQGSAKRGRPNILFAIADDWGAHAGAYGTRWATPISPPPVRSNGSFRGLPHKANS